MRSGRGPVRKGESCLIYLSESPELVGLDYCASAVVLKFYRIGCELVDRDDVEEEEVMQEGARDLALDLPERLQRMIIGINRRPNGSVNDTYDARITEGSPTRHKRRTVSGRLLTTSNFVINYQPLTKSAGGPSVVRRMYWIDLLCLDFCPLFGIQRLTSP